MIHFSASTQNVFSLATNEGKIHVVHNTFVQIAANNGPPAGLIYLNELEGNQAQNDFKV